MKIDLIKGDDADILLMNALAKHYSDDDLFNKIKPGSDSTVDVKLTVNGFEVPFDTIVKNIVDDCNKVHDDEVVDRAMRLLNLAGLDDLRETMRNAREAVELALEAAIRKVEKV
jgi:hypothetical protein